MAEIGNDCFLPFTCYSRLPNTGIGQKYKGNWLQTPHSIPYTPFHTSGADPEAFLSLGKKYEAKALFLFLKSAAFRCVCLLMFLTQPNEAPRSSGWIIREAWKIEKILFFFSFSIFIGVEGDNSCHMPDENLRKCSSKLCVCPYLQTHCCPGGLGSCLHLLHLPWQPWQPRTLRGRKSIVIQCSRKKTGGLTQMKLLAKSKNKSRKEAKK